MGLLPAELLFSLRMERLRAWYSRNRADHTYLADMLMGLPNRELLQHLADRNSFHTVLHQEDLDLSKLAVPCHTLPPLPF